MPLPADLQTRLGDPDFWRAYFDEDENDGDDLEDSNDEDEDSSLIVEFAVGGGYGLVLDIDIGWARSVNLEMRTPARTETLRLGWDDLVHCHPDALRWTELDLIGRAAAIVTPDLRHPGPVLALAGRFVVLGTDDDLDAITPLMDAAYGPPPPAAIWWPSTRDWLHRADGRHNGVSWQQDDAGNWAVDQDEANNVDRDLYSLRCPDGPFPFAPWRELLAAAEITLTAAPALPSPRNKIEECWIEEVRTGAPRGSLIASRFGPSPLRDSRRYVLDLYLPAQRRRPNAYAAELCADLDRTLREAGRGWAMETGAISARGRGFTTFMLSVGITDDFDAGVALVREVLRRHAAGRGTKLIRNGQSLPLD